MWIFFFLWEVVGVVFNVVFSIRGTFLLHFLFHHFLSVPSSCKLLPNPFQSNPQNSGSSRFDSLSCFQLPFPWHKVKYLLSITSISFNIQTILTLITDYPTHFIVHPVVHWKPSSYCPSPFGFCLFWKFWVQAELIITLHPTSLSWSGFLHYKDLRIKFVVFDCF